tara:strand:+ start:184 stop:696 length:513 start_codon:yes stop_codon:yes gene_type:complete
MNTSEKLIQLEEFLQAAPNLSKYKGEWKLSFWMRTVSYVNETPEEVVNNAYEFEIGDDPTASTDSSLVKFTDADFERFPHASVCPVHDSDVPHRRDIEVIVLGKREPAVLVLSWSGLSEEHQGVISIFLEGKEGILQAALPTYLEAKKVANSIPEISYCDNLSTLGFEAY